MEKKLRASLIFHGAIVILLGMLAGFPYALVVLGTMEGELRAWRMAHLEGVLNGLLCIGAGSVIGVMALGDGQRRLLAWAFIAMAYCNVIASIVGAVTGQRGLELAAPISNTVVFLLFMIAIVGVFVGLGLLAYGARPGASGGRGGNVHVEVKTATSSSATASRSKASAIPRGVDVEVSVNKPGAAPVDSGDDDDPDDDEPMNRAERRRAKKGR
jgi:hypothetical protein